MKRKQPPDKELRFTKSVGLQALVDRLNAALIANNEKDETKRNRMLSLISKGTLLVGRIVPFVRRPHTFTQLMLASRIKNAIKRIIKIRKEKGE